MIRADASELYGLAADFGAAPAVVEVRSRVVVRRSTEDTGRDAKAGAPVLSGELRDSIHTVVDGLTGKVIADADHAEYVEDGTSVMPPQPYMGPAVARNEGKFVLGMAEAGDVL